MFSLNMPCPKIPVKLKTVGQTLLRLFKSQGAMVFKVWIQ